MPIDHDPAGCPTCARDHFDLVTTRAIRPDDDEVARNPRARSARLRAWRRAA